MVDEPKREKPHLIRAEVVDEQGNRIFQTIRADQIQAKKTPLHKLTDEQRQRAKRLWETIGKYTSFPTRQQYIDSFSCEREPDRELGINETLARLFHRYCVERQVNDEMRRRQAVRVFLMTSMGTVDVPAIAGVPQEIVDDITQNFGPVTLVFEIRSILIEHYGLTQDDAEAAIGEFGLEPLQTALANGENPLAIAERIVRNQS